MSLKFATLLKPLYLHIGIYHCNFKTSLKAQFEKQLVKDPGFTAAGTVPDFHRIPIPSGMQK